MTQVVETNLSSTVYICVGDKTFRTTVRSIHIKSLATLSTIMDRRSTVTVIIYLVKLNPFAAIAHKPQF